MSPIKAAPRAGVTPPARRSQRNSASLNKSADTPMAAPVMKRSITAKKILPRKTLAALVSAESQSNATSTVEQPRPSSGSARPSAVQAAQQSTPKVSNVAAAPRRSARVSPHTGKENAVLDKSQDIAKSVPDQSTASKIDVLSPILLNVPQSPTTDDRREVMSQKVRRSYSRLDMSMSGSSFLYSPTKNSDSSDTSTPNLASKPGRKSLFGFAKLNTEDDVESKKDGERTRQTFNESSMGASMRLSAEEPDLNIPGVVLVKQKRRKRKVPQIEVSALDEWAAAMNAQFDEAERFDLLVE
ncbi:sororin isoform X2 [Phyllobates terribilis]|uniref:sororin isoform X2 n=1 Tax=Phyllobates terribilis TaxID=111132 RepID=UPI003CCAD284